MFDKDYEKVLELVDSEQVELATSFKSLLHKELVLGQTRWVCRYGTLSDGHEKITDAHRYYQAIKEMYALSGSIRLQKASAMLAQADLLDAQELEAQATKASDKLRAQGKALQAQEQMLTALVTIEDQLRMLDEYDKVRLELKPIVQAQYPQGIEQAERDNWLAVAEYRMLKQQVPGNAPERLDNVPLDPLTKAQYGLHAGRMDAIAPLLVGKKELVAQLEDTTPEHIQKLITQVQEQVKVEELN
jgi:hypothetical protein